MWDSLSSSTTTEASCQNLRALSLQRLSHQNMGLLRFFGFNPNHFLSRNRRTLFTWCLSIYLFFHLWWRPSPSGFTETPSASFHGLLLVLHFSGRIRAHFFPATCHGRRAHLNGHIVSSVIPMLSRPRSSLSLQHSRSFPFPFLLCERVLLLHETP